MRKILLILIVILGVVVLSSCAMATTNVTSDKVVTDSVTEAKKEFDGFDWELSDEKLKQEIYTYLDELKSVDIDANLSIVYYDFDLVLRDKADMKNYSSIAAIFPYVNKMLEWGYEGVPYVLSYMIDNSNILIKEDIKLRNFYTVYDLYIGKLFNTRLMYNELEEEKYELIRTTKVTDYDDDDLAPHRVAFWLYRRSELIREYLKENEKILEFGNIGYYTYNDYFLYGIFDFGFPVLYGADTDYPSFSYDGIWREFVGKNGETYRYKIYHIKQERFDEIYAVLKNLGDIEFIGDTFEITESSKEAKEKIMSLGIESIPYILTYVKSIDLVTIKAIEVEKYRFFANEINLDNLKEEYTPAGYDKSPYVSVTSSLSEQKKKVFIMDCVAEMLGCKGEWDYIKTAEWEKQTSEKIHGGGIDSNVTMDTYYATQVYKYLLENGAKYAS